MSVKISRTEVSDPQKGIINIKHVHKLLDDFTKRVNVECADPSRDPVTKRFYFDIDIKRLKLIASQSEDKATIRINLALTTEDQLDCEENESIANNLSLLVCAIKKDEVKPTIIRPKLKEGDLVLAEGFKDNEEFSALGGGGGGCCVQGHPIFDI